MNTITAIPAPLADPDDRRAVKHQVHLFLLWAVFFACYAWLSLSRFTHYGSRSFDLGIFEQVVRSYAEGRVPVADLLGPGFVIFGDHFSPALALLAPLYYLFPSAQTLLVVQAALFAISVIPVTRAASRLLGAARGWAVGIAYGLSWGVQRAVDFDFHEICFAVPLIAFALEAVLARRWWWALALIAPLVLVKEDLSLTAGAIAGVLALLTWKRNRRFAWVAVGSAVLFVVAWFCITFLVIPSFSPTGAYRYWDKISGDTAFPASLLEGTNEKFNTALWILLPTTGLFALRSPVLLAALPTIGWRFTSLEEHYWSTDWHYNAVLMPIVTLAMVDAIARVRASHPAWLRNYASRLPGLVLAAAAALSLTLPFGALLRSTEDRFDQDPEAAANVLALIPDGVTVEGDNATVAHLTGRTRVFWPGNTEGLIPEYIVVYEPDKNAAEMLDQVRELHPEAEYGLLGEDSGFWALRRVG